MKRVVGLFLCGLLVGTLLVGCGNGNTNNSEVWSNSETSSGSDYPQTPLEIEEYQFEMNGITIAMNMEMAAILEKAGEPKAYFETESCAFQGKDKVYTYDSVVIKTYPDEDVDYVYTVELKDSRVATPENIRIGDSKEAVTACYGEPTKSKDYSLMYAKKDCQLVFVLEDGKTVSSIVYNAVVD